MSKNVLIVDDSEFVRNYHTAILRDASFQVITAGDGMEALEKLFSNPCDLVLTDINMQRMDGYEFMRRVRAEDRYQQLPSSSFRQTVKPRTAREGSKRAPTSISSSPARRK